MIKLHDRVLQTTLAGGAGDLVIGNARVPSYRKLREVSEILLGEEFFYCIEDIEEHAFEIGKGRFNEATDSLQRLSVLTSSNSNQPVTFTTTTVKRVFSVAPEQYVNWLHLHVVEVYTLDNIDVANKFVTITYEPLASSVHLYIAGAPSQAIGLAYTVNTLAKRVTWSNLSLDGLLQVGDIVSVNYVRGIS